MLQTTFNIGNLIPRLLFLVFITISIMMVIRFFIVLNVDIGETEARILMNRFVFSSGCLAYRGSTRSYPGIVDLSKFNPSTLNGCASYGDENNFAAAKLYLNIIDDGRTFTATYNKDGYEIWMPRVDIPGSGGSRAFYDTKYVHVMDGEEVLRAALVFEVVIPNQ